MKWAIGSVVLMVCGIIMLGCAGSSVTPANNVSRASINNVRVTGVSVTLDIAKPNEKLRRELRTELKRAQSKCAKGKVPHRVKVKITEFEAQNVAKTILIGDEIELSGKVSLVRSGGGVTGTYFVNRSFYWGGVAGAALMANPEKSLSRDFSKSVCSKIFSG